MDMESESESNPSWESITRKLIIESCDNALARGLAPKIIHNILYQQTIKSSLYNNNRIRNIHHSLLDTPPPPSTSTKGQPKPKILILIVLLPILVLIFSLSSSLSSRRCLLPSHPLLMEMVRPLANCRLCKNNENNNTPELLELFESPSKSWFQGVAYRGLPIILRNYTSLLGQSSSRLDLHTLKEILDSEPDFWDEEEECQFLPFRSPFTSLKHALHDINMKMMDKVKVKDADEPVENDWDEPWYIGWSNCHPGVAAKLRELVPRPAFLPEESEKSAIDWIFIGSPGLGAAMHIDYVRRPSWQLQLSGCKRWELRPPPECEALCPSSIKFTIHPGDLLFLETNTWYHQTWVEGDQLSISLGSEYD